MAATVIVAPATADAMERPPATVDDRRKGVSWRASANSESRYTARAARPMHRTMIEIGTKNKLSLTLCKSVLMVFTPEPYGYHLA